MLRTFVEFFNTNEIMFMFQKIIDWGMWFKMQLMESTDINNMNSVCKIVFQRNRQFSYENYIKNLKSGKWQNLGLFLLKPIFACRMLNFILSGISKIRLIDPFKDEFVIEEECVIEIFVLFKIFITENLQEDKMPVLGFMSAREFIETILNKKFYDKELFALAKKIVSIEALLQEEKIQTIKYYKPTINYKQDFLENEDFCKINKIYN